MILMLTDAHDIHADVVASHLGDSSVAFFRLNLDVASLRTTSITYEGENWSVTQNGIKIYSRFIQCVWCKRSTVLVDSEYDSNTSNGFRIWRSEWNRALFGFYHSIRSVFWLNNIQHATLADNKYYQMSVAAECGFNIPNLISSNIKSDLMVFANTNGSVALKFMSQDLYRSDKGQNLGLYVNRINPVDLESFGDFSENPITLQTYIEKSFEVRYTVADDDHFVCKISSQDSEITKVDWRRYDISNTPHAAMEPKCDVKKNVKSLMKKLKLKFGALDFIVDQSGDWWFLEVNSGGQWLWIEDLTGLQIAASIAKCLIGRALE